MRTVHQLQQELQPFYPYYDGKPTIFRKSSTDQYYIGFNLEISPPSRIVCIDKLKEICDKVGCFGIVVYDIHKHAYGDATFTDDPDIFNWLQHKTMFNYNPHFRHAGEEHRKVLEDL